MKIYDIESYINGELEGKELQEFESLLNSDTLLRDEVNRSRILLGQLKELSISEKIKKAQQKNRFIKIWRLILLISIFCLVILFLFFYFRSGSSQKLYSPSTETQNTSKPESPKQNPIPDSGVQKPMMVPELPTEKEKNQMKNPPIAKVKKSKDAENYEDIAMNYYSTPEEFAYLRGMTSKTTIDSAKMAFNNEDYIKALSLLNALDKSDPFVKYFKAHVYFKLKNFSEANLLFNQRLSNEDSKIKQQEIEWYHLLNLLACGQKCNASFTKSLQSILSDPNHNYYPQAKNMQGLLDIKN